MGHLLTGAAILWGEGGASPDWYRGGCAEEETLSCLAESTGSADTATEKGLVTQQAVLLLMTMNGNDEKSLF